MAALGRSRDDASNGERAAVGTAVGRLDNAGIDVHFCGISGRTVRPIRGRKLPDIDAVEAAFVPRFTRADAVDFLSNCPLPASAETTAGR